MAPIRLILPAAAGMLLLPACGNFGQVNQGQVVEYRKGSGLITLVSDSNYRDPANPRFDVLPPVTIRTPEDPKEMGPEPEAGKLLLLDPANHRAVIFDAAAQKLLTIPITVLSEQSAAPGARGRKPVIDLARKTITAWSASAHKLVTFSVPDQYLTLTDDTWKSGDVIRYYYKDPGRALRLMNVTRTDLSKAGE
jgi:hypothetical protein